MIMPVRPLNLHVNYCSFAVVILAGLVCPCASASDSEFKRLHALSETFCFACHKAGTAKGDLDLARFDSAEAMRKEADIWQHVVELIADKSMPTRKAAKQPTPGQRQEMLALLKSLMGGSAVPDQRQSLPAIQIGHKAQLAKEGIAFLDKHCISCHGPDKQKGSIRLDKLTGNLQAGDDLQLWQSSLMQLETGQMPPSSRSQPGVRQRYAMTSLIHKALADAGNDLSLERMDANKGNYLSHDLLFGPQAITEYQPRLQARFWRLNPNAWMQTVLRSRVVIDARQRSTTTGGIEPPIALVQEPGIRDLAYRYTISAAEAGQILLSAEAILGRLVSLPMTGGPKKRTPFLMLLQHPDNPTKDGSDAAMQVMFELLLQRKPTAEEQDRYGAFLLKACKSLGVQKGLVVGLKPVFLHPEALFRVEPPKTRPSNHHLLRNLCFALCDSPPPLRWPKDIEKLLKKHGDNPILKKDLKPIARMILNKGVGNREPSNALRFIQEFFDYQKAKDVFKDEETLKKAKIGAKGWNPDSLIEQNNKFIRWVLKSDKEVLRSLLININYGEYRKAETAARKKKKKLTTADLEVIAKTFKVSPRHGLLASPAWLVAHSTNTENDVVHRGKWIRERLLGGQIPDVPITVAAVIPEEPHSTLRERMRVTKEPYCWQCHQRMDPLGFPFEMFDHLGRTRTHELGKPVVTTGSISESGSDDVDGDVSDALELITRLAHSEKVEQSFVRHAFRFYLGRNETIADVSTLQEAHRVYRSSGGSLNELIVYLVTSDSFLNQPAQQAKP